LVDPRKSVTPQADVIHRINRGNSSAPSETAGRKTKDSKGKLKLNRKWMIFDDQ
jgi:hypothetical protein